MTLNSRSKVVLGIVIYTAGKFHIGNPSPLRILSPTPPPQKKVLKYCKLKIPMHISIYEVSLIVFISTYIYVDVALHTEQYMAVRHV